MSKKSENVKLSPPWDGYMNMLASFFKGDKRVRVGGCDDKRVGTIEVFDTKMYCALEQVLNKKIRFGNVTLRIRIVPANDLKAFKNTMTDLAALKVVLSGNPAFAKFITRKTEVGNAVFCMFKPVVLMWYNDNLGSPYKQTASVYELAAQTVFKGCGASYATEPVREEEEDLTSITVCASMASGKWNVTGVAVKPVAEGKPFGRLLETVKKFLDKNIVITVGEGK
mgnify:CR=1 FL=1